MSNKYPLLKIHSENIFRLYGVCAASPLDRLTDFDERAGRCPLFVPHNFLYLFCEDKKICEVWICSFISW